MSLTQADTYTLTTLPNGLRVLTVPLPDRYAVTVAVYIGVGARYESAELAGASHFIEHMVFKGSRQYPTPASLSLAIEGVGGSLDAFTGDDKTGYMARVPAAHLNTALNVIADMLRRPRMRLADVAKERKVILEELAMIYDEAESWVGVIADHLMFGDHPLGRDILGTEASLKAMQRDAVVDFMNAHYRPNNTIIALVGAFEPAQALDRLQHTLGDWAPADTPGFIPAPLTKPGPHVRIGPRQSEQAHIRVSVPGLSMYEPTRHAEQLLSAILGAGMSSRLFLDLREHSALAYNVYSEDHYLHDSGVLSLYAAVDPPRATKTVRALLNHLWRLRDEPVPDHELAKTKEYVKGGILLRLEDTGEIAQSLAGQAVVREELLTAADMVARIEQVTALDVQHVAQSLFRLDRVHLALVGPFKGPDRFVELLKEVV